MDQTTYSITVRNLIDKMRLEEVYMSENGKDREIRSLDINRPGLQLAGFFDYFGPSRVQIFGKVEYTYLSKCTPSERYEKLHRLFEFEFPAAVVTRSLEIFPEMIEVAKEFGVPILRTPKHTSQFVTEVIPFLHDELGERITRHGVLVEVYGEGILLTGESGVGKSETAMELVKRGHRLIADDAVEIRRSSNDELVGTAPELIRHFIELRGIGIVNVRRLFGIGAIKENETIRMIVNMELWDRSKAYERLGLDETYTDILGIKVPSLTIPVKPGRNLAIIIEVAAINNRQKRMGYNAAEDLNQRLIEQAEKNNEI